MRINVLILVLIICLLCSRSLCLVCASNNTLCLKKLQYRLTICLLMSSNKNNAKTTYESYARLYQFLKGKFLLSSTFTNI